MSKKKLTYDDFKKYFDNNLKDKDKHAFEKKVMQDAFEEEAFDGLSELSEEELEKDIAELRSGIKKRTKQSRRLVPIWFKYAAGVVVLVGIGLTFILLNNHFWQDSMLKEQVAKEMEKADSMVKQAEKAKHETIKPTKKDSITGTSKELIADNKRLKEKETPKAEVKHDIAVIEEMEVSEQDYEKDTDEAIETIVFEEQEELTEEDISPITEISTNESKAEIEKQGVEEELAYVTVERETTDKVKDESTLKAREKALTSRSNKAEKVSAPLAYEDKKTTSIVIKGKIVSADDDLSIPGVSVTLKDNPTIGTTTNTDGEFELNIPNDEELKTLIASFVGMETQEISIDNDSNLLVYMEPDLLEMDEVVVTGYGVGQDENAEPVKTNAQPPNDLSMRKFKEQILENLDYSKLSDYPGKHKIKFSFTVELNGSLHNFNFKNVPGIEFSNEIKRVVKELGNWNPATENNFNISSEIKMNLKIEISN